MPYQVSFPIHSVRIKHILAGITIGLSISPAKLAIFTFLGNAQPIEYDHENDVLNLVVIVQL